MITARKITVALCASMLTAPLFCKEPSLTNAFSKEPKDNTSNTSYAYAKEPGVSTGPNGLHYRIIKEGTGKLPFHNDVILFEYTALSSQPKDHAPNPKSAPKIGSYIYDSIPEGWMTFLKRMREGSEYVIYVPGELNTEQNPSFNQNSPKRDVAIYSVKILSIKPYEKISR